MNDEYTIKITGIEARSRRGSWGRIRFVVCDPCKDAWVTPIFPQAGDGCAKWLPVSDLVFAVASGTYLRATNANDRLARARLQLAERGSCDEHALAVDDVDAIWLEDPRDCPPPRR